MSKLNLAFIRSEVKAAVKNSALDTSRVDRWANIAQERIVNDIEPKHLQDHDTFDTVADQRTYYLDINPFKIISLYDQTNDRKLIQVPEEYILDIDPDLSDSGDVEVYSITGLAEVSAQPSSAGVVVVVSSSASDDSQTVRIIGKNTNGTTITEEVSLNGTTNVSTTQSFTTIQSVRKSDYTEGYITTSVGSDTIVVIEAENNTKQFVELNLYYTPSAVATIRTRYLRLPRPLVEPEDIPDMPNTFHYLVLTGTLIEAHKDNYDFEIAKSLDNDLTAELAKYRRNVDDSMNSGRIIRAPYLGELARGYGRLPRNTFTGD